MLPERPQAEHPARAHRPSLTRPERAARRRRGPRNSTQGARARALELSYTIITSSAPVLRTIPDPHRTSMDIPAATAPHRIVRPAPTFV